VFTKLACASHLPATPNEATPLSEIWSLDQHQLLSNQTTIQLYFSTLSGPKPRKKELQKISVASLRSARYINPSVRDREVLASLPRTKRSPPSSCPLWCYSETFKIPIVTLSGVSTNYSHPMSLCRSAVMSLCTQLQISTTW